MAAADDIYFFECVMRALASSHTTTINRSLGSFIQSLNSKDTATVSDDERLMVNIEKLPIVVIHLDQVGIPVIEQCMEVVSPSSFVAQSKHHLEHRVIREILATWRGPQVDSETMLMVYVVPKDKESRYGFNELMPGCIMTECPGSAPSV
ncbi:hypothetical protein V5O48_016865 [Marasmius crinis-equi]|uniref:Uncharacterized protein n=1 Tax=Marasmius crinis-equi TaxID=585013 RepID=A0ABR3EQJ7_9AGAR